MNRPLFTEIIEKVIIGLFAAGVALYANNQVQENRIDNISFSISEIKQQQRESFAEYRRELEELHANEMKDNAQLLVAVQQIQHDLYVPRAEPNARR